jgi:serine/threonine-protein kinase
MNPGDVIDGKYVVDRLLGEGGMAIVYAVTHIKLKRSYAIKVIRPTTLSVPGVAERFLREARAASQLRGDHVGEVSDVGELADGTPFLVMELLDGCDLSKIIETRPLPVELAVDYLLQASEGLAEAHAHAIIHRDLKPCNLFLAKRRNGTQVVKVLDFGIATAGDGEVSGLTQTHSVMGSPQYMSPEQLRSAKSVDARCDIWSLGVTLYELLTMRLPFEGTTFTALAIAITIEPHIPLREAPPALAAVIDRCLEKEPQHRFRNIAELAFALAPFTPGGSAAAQRIAQTLRADGAAHAPAALPLSAEPISALAAGATLPSSPKVTTLGGSASAMVPVEPNSASPARARGWWSWGGLAATVIAVVAAVAIQRSHDAVTTHPTAAPAAAPMASSTATDATPSDPSPTAATPVAPARAGTATPPPAAPQAAIAKSPPVLRSSTQSHPSTRKVKKATAPAPVAATTPRPAATGSAKPPSSTHASPSKSPTYQGTKGTIITTYPGDPTN